jgi:hypothetical protein
LDRSCVLAVEGHELRSGVRHRTIAQTVALYVAAALDVLVAHALLDVRGPRAETRRTIGDVRDDVRAVES